MSPQAEVVTARLRKTWLQWWTFSFWSGAILAAAVSLATLVLFVLVDALLKLPQRVLVSLFAVWAVLSLAAVAALLVRQQRGRRSLAATARRVELAFPELESHLINLVQFAGRDGLETDPFRQAAITQSAAAVADFPFDQAATRENRWRRFLLRMQTPRDLFESFVLLALVLGLAVLCSAVVPAWGSSTRRILHPFTFVPSLGSVKIVKITPGDTEVLIGSSLQIAAEIDNPAQTPSRHALRPPGRQAGIRPGDAPRRDGRQVRRRAFPGPGTPAVPASDWRHADPALQGRGLREADRRPGRGGLRIPRVPESGRGRPSSRTRAISRRRSSRGPS